MAESNGTVQTEQKPFTAFADPKAFRIRYMVQVIVLASYDACEQIDPETMEVCQAETQRACCICATPTCLEHMQRPAYQPCFIHTDKPRPEGDVCCVCLVCAELHRNVQEQVYQFRRKLNEGGIHE